MTAAFSSVINKYQGVAPKQVINAVADAAKKTGVDFSFLMEKAAAESGFRTDVRAKTSSATGLFQFIDSTWLGMIKEHGAKYGLGNMADKIDMKNGRACVTDCDTKKQILDLRKDPHISALMAGEFSAANRKYLERKTQGDVGRTELYLAHFMGAGAAAKFINSRDANGQAKAADLFPREAAANKSIFFDKQGRARSLNEVYDRFARKFGDEDMVPAQKAPVMVASAVQKGAVSATAACMPFSGHTASLFPPDASAQSFPAGFAVDNLLLLAQIQQMETTFLRSDLYGRG